MLIAHRELPSDLSQDDLDEIAVFQFRLAEAMLAMAREQPPQQLTPEIVRRRQAFVENTRAAERHLLEIKRAGNGRLAAAVARLKAKDQYGPHPATGVLAGTC